MGQEKHHQNPDGNKLKLLQSVTNEIRTTEFIYLNGERIMDGEVNYNEKYLLIIKDGKFLRLKRKKSILQSITDLFKNNN